MDDCRALGEGLEGGGVLECGVLTVYSLQFVMWSLILFFVFDFGVWRKMWMWRGSREVESRECWLYCSAEGCIEAVKVPLTRLCTHGTR